MSLASWLLIGILVSLVGILLVLIGWLRAWQSFVRDYREGHESMKRLLLGNFADLLELQRINSSLAGKETADSNRVNQNGEKV